MRMMENFQETFDKEDVKQVTLRVLLAEAMDWLPAVTAARVRASRKGLSAQLVAERLEKSPTAISTLMHQAMRNLQYSIGLEPEEITQIVAPSEEEVRTSPLG